MDVAFYTKLGSDNIDNRMKEQQTMKEQLGMSMMVDFLLSLSNFAGAWEKAVITQQQSYSLYYSPQHTYVDKRYYPCYRAVTIDSSYTSHCNSRSDQLPFYSPMRNRYRR